MDLFTEFRTFLRTFIHGKSCVNNKLCYYINLSRCCRKLYGKNTYGINPKCLTHDRNTCAAAVGYAIFKPLCICILEPFGIASWFRVYSTFALKYPGKDKNFENMVY